jgi:glycolate oxidase FAD binding subunit
MATGGRVFRELVGICGIRFARRGAAADAVAGVTPTWVAVPASVDGASAVMRVAAEHGLTVVARGAGTKLHWGSRPGHLDLLVDTARLAGIWHHPIEESYAEIGAGTPVRAAQAALGRVGQRLALDPGSDGATVGGVIATDESGPLAHRHGTAGDQLLGVSYVGPNGLLSHSAGRGVGRLLCGSFGGLGVLVAATLKVLPAPAARAWVHRSVWTPLEVHDLVDVVVADPVQVAAIEVDLPVRGPRGLGALSVLLEGAPAVVAEQARRVATLLGGDAEVYGEAPEWWGRYSARPHGIALRITVPTSDLHAAVYALRDAAGHPVPVRGSAGLGVVHAALPGDTPPDRAVAILDAVRGVLLARAGSCVVVSAPGPVRDAVDMWGPVATQDVLRRVKSRFDPDARLAPGRFFGI